MPAGRPKGPMTPEDRAAMLAKRDAFYAAHPEREQQRRENITAAHAAMPPEQKAASQAKRHAFYAANLEAAERRRAQLRDAREIRWSAAMDEALIAMRADGQSWPKTAARVGVTINAAKRRYRLLTSQRGEGEGLQPPARQAADFETLSLHGPDMTTETSHRVVCSAQTGAHVARR